MHRTYNPFIDNGIFVAAYYLDKQIEDVTIKDITDDTFLCRISDTIGTILLNQEYDSMARVTFNNSSYTQGGKDILKTASIMNQFQELKDAIGSDKTCIYCGRKTVNVNYIANRKMMPGFISNTFFNSSNNLKHTDICTHCLLFSMFSFLNVRKAQGFVVYESDCNDFLYEHTKEMALRHDMEMLTLNRIEDLEMCCDSAIENTSDDFYIKQISFANGKDVKYDIITVDDYKIRFLRKLKYYNLSSQFKENNWFYSLATNTNTNILYDITRSDSPKICTSKLLFLYMKEVLGMDNNTIDYLYNVTKKLTEIDSVDNLKKELHNTATDSNKFKELIIKWQQASTEGIYENPRQYLKLTDFQNRLYLLAMLSLKEFGNEEEK